MPKVMLNVKRGQDGVWIYGDGFGINLTSLADRGLAYRKLLEVAEDALEVADSVEESRQDELMTLDDEKNWLPGTFGCHELLDRVDSVNVIIGDMLLSHPALHINAEWYAMACQANDILADLYQAIGEKHLGTQTD